MRFADLREVEMVESTLVDLPLTGTDLRKARATRSSLTRIDLTWSDTSGFEMVECRLEGTHLTPVARVAFAPPKVAAPVATLQAWHRTPTTRERPQAAPSGRK
jgi:hypothetical protein